MYIYKILPSAPPQPLPEAFPLSPLDQEDGFVHLSTAEQVPQTCGLFFADATTLWIVKLDLANFESSIKWENSFPHLYGNFGASGIESIQQFHKVEGKTWQETMADSQWLQ